MRGGVGSNIFHYYSGSSISVHYSDLQSGINSIAGPGSAPSSYTNNISSTPQFTGTGTHPYALEANSLCYNAGDPSTQTSQTGLFDLAGKPRIFDELGTGVIDMGAYEYPAFVFGGPIYNDAIWGFETVAISSDVTINNGATLTILPGSTIDFLGHHRINVLGTIVARAPIDSVIHFTQLDPSGGWDGIHFENTAASNDSSLFLNCEFSEARALGAGDTGNGSCFYISNARKIRIEHSLFHTSAAQGLGGAVYMNNAEADLLTCSFDGLTASSGAGIYATGNSTLRVRSCLFHSGLASSGGGGAIALTSGAQMQMLNCTAVSNSSSLGKAVYFSNSGAAIENSVFGDTHSIYLEDDASDPDIVYSNLNDMANALNGNGSGASYTGVFEHNTSVDPAFDSSSEYPYQLSEMSPLINAGNPQTTTALAGALDRLQHERIYGGASGVIDVGAFEYQGVPTQISGHVVWDQDTMHVNGNVIILDGATLEIQPGTTVEMLGHFRFSVGGRLLARGTEQQPILFTVADTTYFSNTSLIDGGWAGIEFNHTSASNDSSLFENCVFEYGKAVSVSGIRDIGGVFSIDHTDKLAITTSIFRHNLVEGAGGAIWINDSAPHIRRCIFENNRADNGGAIALSATQSKIDNCLFITNDAGSTGGALSCNNGDEAQILNSTMTENSAGTLGGALFANGNATQLKSCILWNNMAGFPNAVHLNNSGNQADFSFCDIQGGFSDFTGSGSGGGFAGAYMSCIAADPLFVMQGQDPYALQQLSPCLNLGDIGLTTTELGPFDLAGNPRIYTASTMDAADMGPYEYQGPANIGSITENTVWSGNILVTGDISILDGVTLDVSPGTRIEFQGYYKLDVQGTLRAEGSAQQMIEFTVPDTTGFDDLTTGQGGWNGLHFQNTSNSNAPSRLSYCVLEYAKAVDLNNDNLVSSTTGGLIHLTNSSGIEISHSVIRNNRAALWGGAIYLSSGSISLIQNDIYNNSAAVGGFFYASGDTCSFVGNQIHHNSATSSGGAAALVVSSSNWLNNTITENNATNGGGLYYMSNSQPDIRNTIFWGNTVSGAGAQIYLNETNADPDFSYCLIEGGRAGFAGPGSGAAFGGAYDHCRDEDPGFLNTTPWPYRTQQLSPCVNGGDPLTTTGEVGSVDLSGETRIYQSILAVIDMGAFEYQGEALTGAVSSDLSIGPGVIPVIGDVIVDAGAELTVMPGTTLNYLNHSPLIIRGTLQAQGSNTDWILFTAADSAIGWSGLEFESGCSADTSRISFCHFEYGRAASEDLRTSGGAIFVDTNVKLTVSNSHFENNSASVLGGAMACFDSQARITHCNFDK